MVGFGAGAWSIAILDRVSPSTPMPCGDYAPEDLPDGGAGGSAGAAGAAGTNGGGGGGDDDGGCGCRVPRGETGSALLLALLAAALLFGRRLTRS
jgi:MYXO-CTERM domain-containing protein